MQLSSVIENHYVVDEHNNAHNTFQLSEAVDFRVNNENHSLRVRLRPKSFQATVGFKRIESELILFGNNIRHWSTPYIQAKIQSPAGSNFQLGILNETQNDMFKHSRITFQKHENKVEANLEQ